MDTLVCTKQIVMVVCFLSRCCFSFTLILLFITLLSYSSQHEKLTKDGNVFLALGMNTRSFPSRNSGLPRRSTSGFGIPPSQKLQAVIYLINISLSASYLVLLAGDVSRNPGPVKDLCNICSKGCRSNQKAVQCDGCDNWFHAKCMNIGNAEYHSLTINESSNWMCMTCIFPGINCMNDSINISVVEEEDEYGKNEDNTEIRMLRGFKIAHLNVNRLRNKLDSVKELILKHSFDILTLSETWLTPDIDDTEINIPGYSTVREDRSDSTKSCGGGVVIYLREGIPFTVNPYGLRDNLECLWVEIKRSNCKRMILCCTYRPDDQNIDDFILNLDDTLKNTDVERSEVVLLGDFNVDYSVKP